MLILQKIPSLLRQTRADFIGVGFSGAASTNQSFGNFSFLRRGLAVIQCFDQSPASHVVLSITVGGRIVKDFKPGAAGTRAFACGTITVPPGSHNVTVAYDVATTLVACVAVWVLPAYMRGKLDPSSTGANSSGTSTAAPFWRAAPNGLMLWSTCRGDSATATTYSGNPRNVMYEQVQGSVRITVVEVPYPGQLTQAWGASAGIGSSLMYVR